MKKNLLLLLTVLFSLCTTNAWAATETYVKVTSAPSDWSGEYLIVYESGTVAFNGNLTTLDATSNTTSVAISNSKISLDPKYSFTIAKSDDNYTIKSASGYYIGQTSNANGLASQNTTSYANTISINDNGTVNLVSGGAYLRYNATSGQTRFRYFKSTTYTGQKAICLYKKAADVTTYTVTYDLNGGTGTTPTQANVAAGGTFTLAASSGFSRTGYSFAGWNDGTTTYNAGATYTMPAKAVTLKAQWTVLSSATITLSEAGVTTSVTGKYVGDSYTLPSTTSQSCGDKTFVGWSTVQVAETDAKPTSNYYELGEQVTLAASQTFYAVFATKETSGSGTAGWNKVTSTSDLEAGATYAISNAATAGTYLSTWDGGNNFDGSTSTICPLILGGSESAWTFQIADGSTYNNYFLTATNTTEKNYLKAVENADNYSNFTISFTDGAAVITCTEKNSRNILRYNANNGSPIFACYSSGQSAVYLQKYSTGTTTTYSDYTTQCTTETVVSLNANGGTGTMADVTTVNGTLTLPKCTFTREGYTFAGWATSASGEVAFADEEVVSNWDTDITELFAQWTSNKTATSLSWSADDYAATIDADNTFPTLTKSPADLSPIAYSSSNTSVATIDTDGNITLKADGTTTIKATFAETDTHAGASDSYTLTVYPSNCRWEEVTIDEIEYGDEVVVMMAHGETLYALPYNSETASNSNPVATTITLNNFTGTIDETLIWYIMKDADNNFTLSPKTATDKYLTCNSSNNAVRVNTGENRYFTIENDFLRNTTFNTYLAISTTASPKDWRHFSSTNTTIANKYQTLKFYKKVCLDAEHYWVTWDANEGTWTDGSTKKVEEYQVGATITKPADPTRDGYQFAGWTPTPSTMPAANTTFTAQWTEVYTVTWMVGSTSALSYEVANGTGVTDIPANQADDAIGSCANKFMGWSESNLGSAEGQAAPTDLCTAEEMKAKYTSVTGDKTFYAVFATNSGGGGQTITWVKTAGKDVTEGIYALLTSDNKAFNGTIISGDGQITTTAFSFTDDVATSAPEGTCEITFTTSSKGFTMYNSTTSKYLYAKDDASGNLAWQTSESSYWYFDDYNDDNWTYKANDAVLRSNGGEIRTYGSNTGSRLVFAKKTITGIPPSYSNYVTSCCGLVPVTDVVVSDITANSAKLTWTAPNTTTGISELEIRDAEDEVLVDGIDVNATSATISGLSDCTTYSVYVVSVGECDAKSEIVSFTTLLSDPKTVTFVYGNGEENSTATTNCESSSITLPTPSWTGYRFLGWYNASSGGSKIGDGGASYTPANDITLYAHWEELARFTVTYSVGSGDTAPAAVEALDGSSITMPALESNLYCVSFVGWTDATTYNHGTSALYEVGDSYTVTSNVTLKAVYAEGTGYVLVEDVANLAANDKVIIVNNDYSKAMGANVGTYSEQVGVQIIDKKVQLVSGVEVLTLEAGTVPNSWAFNTGEGYLCATSSSDNQLGTQVTNDANGSWSIVIADGVATVTAQGTYSRNTMRYNDSASRFACYKASTNTVQDVSIYKENITGYTTNPACEMYNVNLCETDNGTLSVNKNSVEPYGSVIVTFTPNTGYMLQTVTLTGSATQGETSYILDNPTGTANVTFSNIQSDIDVCATFKAIPLYTVTFVDMNNDNSQTTQTQESYGADITAPTTASEPCYDTWEFVGWAPSSSIQGSTDVPTGLIQPGGTISGTNITDNSLKYYSVYTNQNNGTLPFAIGKSGTYYFKVITANAVEYYAYDEINSSHRYPGTGTTKIPFELTYNNVTEKYTIKNTLTGKYLSPDYDDGNEIYELDYSYDWDIMQPTLYADAGTSAYATTGEYLFHYTNVAGDFRALYYTGYFESAARDNGANYALYLEPATATYYYNRSDCSTSNVVTMTFYNPFGNEGFSWTAGYPVGYYTNVPKGTTIQYFPTMEYNGWAFIGWTDTDYNQGKILDDENSTSDIPADIKIYNNTAGLTYSLTSDVTMYPLFTKYDDNTDVDLENGGEYYMYFYREGDYYKDDYFGLDNHYQRVYAADGGGEGKFGYTFNCSAAQLFEFIKDGDGWNIRVKNADGTYPTKSYLVNTSENDYDLVASEPSDTWSITKTSEGDYQMWYRGNAGNSEDNVYYQAKAREYSGGTSWDFKCYNQDNDASAFYYKVYLGTCENRVFSSNPSNKPAITMNGEPIVTSTQDQSIRAQGELSISATKLAANGTITLTSDNADVYFSSVKDANFTQATKPLASLTLNADEKGKLAMTTVYVHYKPTSTSSLGVQTANITATTGTEGEEDYATAETTAQVRNLSAKFVIATKVGATWYALPADMNTASNPLGVVIEVDETNMTATAPNSCTYTLFPVKTTNTEYDRYEEYGDRLRFSAVNNSYKGLWANNSKTDLTINNDMVIDQASDGQTGSDLANNSYYEWKVTTTVVDGHWQYTLQTDQTQNQNYLRYWTSAEGTPVGPKWGTYNAGENKLYFLPVTETQPFEYAVVEWYPTKMLIQTDAAIASPTVKIRGEEVATPVLTSKGGKLYEISNLPLETNPNEVLQVSFTADAVNYVNAKVVPIILSREAKSITGEPFATLTQKVYQYADVVVRDGATLTIDGGTDVANTLLGVTIYPTAKVSVAEGKKLSVHNLTFFGGIDEIYDGSAYTINKYGVPQLSLKGTLGKTITNIDYIMRVNLDQMYQVGVPYDVNLSDITYWDGTTMTLGDNLYVSAYDGQKRANREEKSWVWETDFTEKVLKAGIGYTISADKQDAAHEYSIIRMPMKNNITSGNTEIAKTVQVFAYDNKNGVEITDNHKGWNYLSNPYMVAISGAEADSKLVVGYLRETGTGPWEWVDDTYRYVTIPSDDGKWYDQQKFEEATLLPFKSFFLQIAESGELSFALASRQNVPARYLQSSNEQREVEFEVLLANDTRSDNLGFLIGEDYTPAYEINADLEKMIGSMSVYTIYNGYNLAYNALSPANAEEQIPIGYVVPTVGEYTFALDESSDIEDVEHIYLIDYETSAITDLVTDVYTFTTLEQKSDTRFAINVALKSKDNAATGLDNMNTNGELPTKFIYHDKIFILHHGVIYDATGKRVITINK